MPASRVGWGFMIEVDFKITAAICPGCDQPMKLVDIQPILSTKNLIDVIFRCEKCAMITARAIRRDNEKS
jgi:RNase P subunit RPR2